MKRESVFFAVLLAFFGLSTANAQINFGEKALGAIQNGMAGLTFSDAEAAQLSKAAATKMDAEYIIAGPTDPYTIRLKQDFCKIYKCTWINLKL